MCMLWFLTTAMCPHYESDCVLAPSSRSNTIVALAAHNFTVSTRRYETLIARLRIGHTELTHSYIREKQPSPICTICDTPLTVEHILISCRKFTNIRHQLHMPNNLPTILGDDPTMVSKTIKFMELTKLIQLI